MAIRYANHWTKKITHVEQLTGFKRFDDTTLNKLEKLKGDLKEFYSIRINSQWRIIFKWDNSNATEVQILDYH